MPGNMSSRTCPVVEWCVADGWWLSEVLYQESYAFSKSQFKLILTSSLTYLGRVCKIKTQLFKGIHSRRIPSIPLQYLHSTHSYPNPCIPSVVPEQSAVEKWALAAGHVNGIHYDQLAKKDAVKRAIMKEMAQLAKDNDLKSFEQVKDIFVSSELWSVENDLLTPTFKVKRNVLKKAFTTQLEQMYSCLWWFSTFFPWRFSNLSKLVFFGLYLIIAVSLGFEWGMVCNW